MGELPEGWTIARLEDVVEPGSLTYGIVQPGADVSGGVPIVRVKDLEGGRVNIAHPHRVAAAIESRYKRSRLRGGEVLLSLVGSVGSTAIASAELSGWNIARAIAVLRPQPGIESRWLQLCLGAAEAQQFMAERVTTTVQATLNLRDVKEITLPLPPPEERRALVDVLGALDDKIESNRRLMSVIDELVPALTPSGSSEDASVSLGDVATLQKGVSYRRSDLNPSSTAMVSLKCFARTGEFQPEGLKEFTGRAKPSQRLQPCDVVVAQTDLTQGAEVVGRTLRIPASTGYAGLVASLDLMIVRPLSIESEYLFGVLIQDRFRQHCRARTSGTTVLHLASDALPGFRFRLASPADQSAYVARVRPLLEQRDRVAGESRTLAELRDALLPELLSGRLRVPVPA